MAVSCTVTPSTQYLEDNITLKITSGSLPSGAQIVVLGELSSVSQIEVARINISGNTKTFKMLDGWYDVDYFYNNWSSQTTSIKFIFVIVDRNSDSISNKIYKTLKIKPQPPTFDVTPTYEDVKTQSLSLTNNNQMIVNGLSTIRISNLVGTAYKGGTLKTIKINDVSTNYDYDTIINGTGYIDIELDNIKLNKELVVTLIDSRGWSITETIANISKFKYLWLNPKINNLEAEHNGVSETTPLTASGLYSEGYQLGTTTFSASYSYKENVEGSSEVSGLSTLNISKNKTREYENFLAILEEYNNPTYQIDNEDSQYYDRQTFENGINVLFSSAISYNDKYTQEYLQTDYDSTNERYYCKSGGYNGSWKQFWRETLENIYDEIVENGGNYEWSIEESAIQGDLQSGFSIDKTFFINLLVENTISGLSKNAQSQVLLPTAIPAIDVYKSNVAIHGLYDENLGGTQINGNLFLNGEGLFEQKVLWQGVSHMSGTQSITLSENITDQKHGIVLIWSGYNNGVQDYNFVCQFIPKMAVELFPGDGFSILLGGNTGLTSHKYIYVNNNRIVGNANNIGTNTLNGVTYNNEMFALRRVIGI